VRADVVVVGAGLAGLVAAVRAAEAGRKVVLLSKGVGSTHLAPGTVDVLGYAPQRVQRPLAALPGFLDAHPDHPYARVGVEGIRAALAWYRDLVGLAGDLEENLLLPTAVGAAKPSALAPPAIAAGDLRDPAPICVVGFRALRDFHPAYCADNLRHQGHAARGITLDVPTQRPDENALGLARAFEDAGFRDLVVRRLDGRLEAGERVGFPAVLGQRDRHAEVWRELETRLGHPVFEIPTLPPSVPGIRAHRALEGRLKRAGGHPVMNATVNGVEARGGRVVAVRAGASGRTARYPAKWVVLATGGWASGGLALDSRWRARETALGLPLTGVPGPGEPRFGPEYFGEQPLARAGVAVDDGLRPLDADGERVYENVLVAGATLAGAAAWTEGSGDGISLATGHAAGLAVTEGSRTEVPA